MPDKSINVIKKTGRFELTAIIKDRKGNILSIGKNSYFKTHPLMVKLARHFGEFNTKKIYIHAEIDAIIKCKSIEKAHSIEIYRMHNFNKKYLPSMPCKICMSGIAQTPIKEIIFVNSKHELDIVYN